MLKIYKLGEKILREKCVPVEKVTDEMRTLFGEMFETMIEKNGVGLAAPQIGRAERFFVVIADDEVRRVFVNPEIIKTSQNLVPYEEGCLSVPEHYESIVRPDCVSVCALDENGKPFTLNAEGLLARIIQHEVDHLNGIIFIDKGDPNFAKKTEEDFRRRAERAQKKQQVREAKAKKIAAKIAARNAKKSKKI